MNEEGDAFADPPIQLNNILRTMWFVNEGVRETLTSPAWKDRVERGQYPFFCFNGGFCRYFDQKERLSDHLVKNPSHKLDSGKIKEIQQLSRAIQEKRAESKRAKQTSRRSKSPSSTRSGSRHRSSSRTRRSRSNSRNRRSRSSSRTKRHGRSKSPVRYKRSRSPTYYKRSRSPSHHKRSRSPVYHRRSGSPGYRRSGSPGYRRSGSPGYRRSRSPRNKRSRSPNYRRSRSPNYKRSISPIRYRRSNSPGYRKRSISPTRYRNSRSPTYHRTSSGRPPSPPGTPPNVRSLVPAYDTPPSPPPSVVPDYTVPFANAPTAAASACPPLNNNLVVIHAIEDQFVCEGCKESLSSNENLLQHRKECAKLKTNQSLKTTSATPDVSVPMASTVSSKPLVIVPKPISELTQSSDVNKNKPRMVPIPMAAVQPTQLPQNKVNSTPGTDSTIVVGIRVGQPGNTKPQGQIKLSQKTIDNIIRNPMTSTPLLLRQDPPPTPSQNVEDLDPRKKKPEVQGEGDVIIVSPNIPSTRIESTHPATKSSQGTEIEVIEPRDPRLLNQRTREVVELAKLPHDFTKDSTTNQQVSTKKIELTVEEKMRKQQEIMRKFQQSLKLKDPRLSGSKSSTAQKPSTVHPPESPSETNSPAAESVPTNPKAKVPLLRIPPPSASNHSAQQSAPPVLQSQPWAPGEQAKDPRLESRQPLAEHQNTPGLASSQVDQSTKTIHGISPLTSNSLQAVGDTASPPKTPNTYSHDEGKNKPDQSSRPKPVFVPSGQPNFPPVMVNVDMSQPPPNLHAMAPRCPPPPRISQPPLPPPPPMIRSESMQNIYSGQRMSEPPPLPPQTFQQRRELSKDPRLAPRLPETVEVVLGDPTRQQSLSKLTNCMNAFSSYNVLPERTLSGGTKPTQPGQVGTATPIRHLFEKPVTNLPSPSRLFGSPSSLERTYPTSMTPEPLNLEDPDETMMSDYSRGSDLNIKRTSLITDDQLGELMSKKSKTGLPSSWVNRPTNEALLNKRQMEAEKREKLELEKREKLEIEKRANALKQKLLVKKTAQPLIPNVEKNTSLPSNNPIPLVKRTVHQGLLPTVETPCQVRVPSPPPPPKLAHFDSNQTPYKPPVNSAREKAANVWNNDSFAKVLPSAQLHKKTKASLPITPKISSSNTAGVTSNLSSSIDKGVEKPTEVFGTKAANVENSLNLNKAPHVYRVGTKRPLLPNPDGQSLSDVKLKKGESKDNSDTTTVTPKEKRGDQESIKDVGKISENCNKTEEKDLDTSFETSKDNTSETKDKPKKESSILKALRELEGSGKNSPNQKKSNDGSSQLSVLSEQDDNIFETKTSKNSNTNSKVTNKQDDLVKAKENVLSENVVMCSDKTDKQVHTMSQANPVEEISPQDSQINSLQIKSNTDQQTTKQVHVSSFSNITELQLETKEASKSNNVTTKPNDPVGKPSDKTTIDGNVCVVPIQANKSADSKLVIKLNLSSDSNYKDGKKNNSQSRNKTDLDSTKVAETDTSSKLVKQIEDLPVNLLSSELKEKHSKITVNVNKKKDRNEKVLCESNLLSTSSIEISNKSEKVLSDKLQEISSSSSIIKDQNKKNIKEDFLSFKETQGLDLVTSKEATLPTSQSKIDYNSSKQNMSVKKLKAIEEQSLRSENVHGASDIPHPESNFMTEDEKNENIKKLSKTELSPIVNMTKSKSDTITKETQSQFIKNTSVPSTNSEQTGTINQETAENGKIIKYKKGGIRTPHIILTPILISDGSKTKQKEKNSIGSNKSSNINQSNYKNEENVPASTNMKTSSTIPKEKSVDQIRKIEPKNKEICGLEINLNPSVSIADHKNPETVRESQHTLSNSAVISSEKKGIHDSLKTMSSGTVVENQSSILPSKGPSLVNMEQTTLANSNSSTSKNFTEMIGSKDNLLQRQKIFKSGTTGNLSTKKADENTDGKYNIDTVAKVVAQNIIKECSKEATVVFTNDTESSVSDEGKVTENVPIKDQKKIGTSTPNCSEKITKSDQNIQKINVLPEKVHKISAVPELASSKKTIQVKQLNPIPAAYLQSRIMPGLDINPIVKHTPAPTTVVKEPLGQIPSVNCVTKPEKINTLKEKKSGSNIKDVVNVPNEPIILKITNISSGSLKSFSNSLHDTTISEKSSTKKEDTQAKALSPSTTSMSGSAYSTNKPISLKAISTKGHNTGSDLSTENSLSSSDSVKKDHTVIKSKSSHITLVDKLQSTSSPNQTVPQTTVMKPSLKLDNIALTLAAQAQQNIAVKPIVPTEANIEAKLSAQTKGITAKPSAPSQPNITGTVSVNRLGNASTNSSNVNVEMNNKSNATNQKCDAAKLLASTHVNSDVQTAAPLDNTTGKNPIPVKTTVTLNGSTAKTSTTLGNTTVKTNLIQDTTTAKTSATMVNTTAKTSPTQINTPANTSATLVNITAKTSTTLVNTTAKTSTTLVNTTAKTSPTLANVTAKTSPTLVNTTSKTSPTQVNSPANTSATLVNTTAKTSTTIVNSTTKTSPTLANTTAKTSPTLANVTEKTSPTQVKITAKTYPTQVNTPANSSASLVNTTAKTSTTFVNTTAKTSTTFVNTTAKTSTTFVNSTAKTSPTLAKTTAETSPTLANVTAKTSPTQVNTTAKTSPTQVNTPANTSATLVNTAAKTSTALVNTTAKTSTFVNSTAKTSPTLVNATAKTSPTQVNTPANTSTTLVNTTIKTSSTQGNTTAKKSLTQVNTTANTSATLVNTTAKTSSTLVNTTAETSTTRINTNAKPSTTQDNTTAKMSPMQVNTTANTPATLVNTIAKSPQTLLNTTAKTSTTLINTTSKTSTTKVNTTAKTSTTHVNTTAKMSPTQTNTTDNTSATLVNTLEKSSPTLINTLAKTSTTFVNTTAKTTSTRINTTAKTSPTNVNTTAKTSTTLVNTTANTSATLVNTTATTSATLVNTTATTSATVVNTTANTSAALVNTAANTSTTLVNTIAKSSPSLVNETAKISPTLSNTTAKTSSTLVNTTANLYPNLCNTVSKNPKSNSLPVSPLLVLTKNAVPSSGNIPTKFFSSTSKNNIQFESEPSASIKNKIAAPTKIQDSSTTITPAQANIPPQTVAITNVNPILVSSPLNTSSQTQVLNSSISSPVIATQPIVDLSAGQSNNLPPIKIIISHKKSILNSLLCSAGKDEFKSTHQLKPDEPTKNEKNLESNSSTNLVPKSCSIGNNQTGLLHSSVKKNYSELLPEMSNQLEKPENVDAHVTIKCDVMDESKEIQNAESPKNKFGAENDKFLDNTGLMVDSDVQNVLQKAIDLVIQGLEDHVKTIGHLKAVEETSGSCQEERDKEISLFVTDETETLEAPVCNDKNGNSFKTSGTPSYIEAPVNPLAEKYLLFKSTVAGIASEAEADSFLTKAIQSYKVNTGTLESLIDNLEEMDDDADIPLKLVKSRKRKNSDNNNKSQKQRRKPAPVFGKKKKKGKRVSAPAEDDLPRKKIRITTVFEESMYEMQDLTEYTKALQEKAMVERATAVPEPVPGPSKLTKRPRSKTHPEDGSGKRAAGLAAECESSESERSPITLVAGKSTSIDYCPSCTTRLSVLMGGYTLNLATLDISLTCIGCNRMIVIKNSFTNLKPFDP